MVFNEPLSVIFQFAILDIKTLSSCVYPMWSWFKAKIKKKMFGATALHVYSRKYSAQKGISWNAVGNAEH